VSGEAIGGGEVAGSFGGDDANQDGTALPANTHVHVPPNFSAFASPEEAVGLALGQGIRVLGTANYYDYRIYRRFEAAATSAGIVPLFGNEFHTDAEDLYEIRINDPSNPGQFNLCGKGLTHFDPPTESAAHVIATMRAANAVRMRTMVELLAQHFIEAGLTGGPSYTQITATVARRSGVPEAWVALQERHVAEAFQELLFSSASEHDRPAVLDRLWGRQPTVDAADVVAVQEALRSHLLKFGKPAFVPETELTFVQAYRLILDLGGIPCYPIFADAASSISEFEDPPEALVERLLDRRLYCAELFPSRNRPEIVDRYVLALRGAGIIVVAGTDHNTKEMTPLSPTAGGEPLSPRARRAFWEGTCVVAAHQELRMAGRPGYVDPTGALAAGFGDSETRIRWFAQAGEDAVEIRTAARAGHDPAESRAPAAGLGLSAAVSPPPTIGNR
jgi:hypothetical protein